MRNDHLFGKVSYLTAGCDGCDKWVAPIFGGGVQCGWCGWAGHWECGKEAAACAGRVKEERVHDAWGEARVGTILGKGVQRSPVVSLRYEKLGDEWCGVLCDQLTLSKALISVDLTGNRLNAAGCCSVAALLQHCPSLTSLSLAANIIMSEGLLALSTHLRDAGSLTLLDVSKNRITDSSIPPLHEALRHNTTLKTLIITDNALTEPSLVKLASLPFVRDLDIGGNSFIPRKHFIKKLTENLLQSSVTSLGFKGSSKGMLECEGAVYFADLLRSSSCKLQSIDLSCNGIGNEGLFSLSQAIRGNSCVKELSLSGNKFEENAVQVLSGCLSESVTSLDVRDVSITPEGITHLTKLPLAVQHGMSLSVAPVELEKPKQPHWYGWCSSCYLHEEHTVVLLMPFPKRSLYQCRGCKKIGVSCLHPFCTSMANKHHHETALFCAVHNGVIPHWGGRPKQLLRWCSWCLLLTNHTLCKANDFSRDAYCCLSCDKRTLKCKKCSDGMSRGSLDSFDDVHCARCSGGVQQWVADAEVIKATLKSWEVEGWCSWCFEDTLHDIESKGRMRNSYRCQSCCRRTLKCVRCSAGMTAGQLLCAQCEQLFTASFSLPWESLSEAKNLIFRGHEQRTLIEDLSRQSNYKTLAKKAGLIRPFLLLVAMGADCRVRAALSVDITLVKCPCFGDSHSESWYIIKCGIAARSMDISEKITPLKPAVQWLTVLKRVVSAYAPTSGEEMENSEEGERLVLRIVANLMMAKVNGEEVERLRNVLGSGDMIMTDMKNRLSSVGITEESTLLFALYSILHVVKKRSDEDSVRSSNTSLVADEIYKLIAVKDGSKPRRLTPSVVVPTLFLPFTPLTLPILAVTSLSAYLSPSCITLLPLVISLLTQRLLLATEGIDIKDFT